LDARSVEPRRGDEDIEDAEARAGGANAQAGRHAWRDGSRAAGEDRQRREKTRAFTQA